MNNINENAAQQQYWSMMTQFKYDLFFYEIKYKYCILFERYFKCIIGFGTVFLSTFLVIIKDDETLSFAFLLLISIIQAISFLDNYMPFNRRMIELREMCEKLQPLYDSVEIKWRMVSTGQYDTVQIYKTIDEFNEKSEKIKDGYLKDDYLSRDKKSMRYAKDNTDSYFDNFIKKGEKNEQEND